MNTRIAEKELLQNGNEAFYVTAAALLSMRISR